MMPIPAVVRRGASLAPRLSSRSVVVVLVGVLGACKAGKDEKLTPCERWKAAVDTCVEQADVVLDTGIALGVDTDDSALGSTATCSSDPANDPEWLKDLYNCYANAYSGIDCADPAQVVEVGIFIADCGVIHGG